MFKVERRKGEAVAVRQEVGVILCNSYFHKSFNLAYFVHIHTTDKRVLCKKQMPFSSFVLPCKCKAYDSGNVPEEISKTPLTGSQLKALIGDMS